ncbi:GspH/FimT family pseudopilin [Acinetobacter defluvii]|uniref:GspH/FimT family pseudopilin n=1 Tax=Acinetobacter defluvii TaxID=1871111 RepID=UPI003AF8D8C0
MRKERGFTLIELLVTMVVLAIIATMAVPAFGNMRLNQNLKKSQQELISKLNLARSQAVLQRRTVTLKLNSATPDTTLILNWAPTGDAVLKTGSPTQIDFTLNGMVDATTDTTFEVCERSSGNKSKKVIVSKMGTIQQVAAEGTC